MSRWRLSGANSPESIVIFIVMTLPRWLAAAASISLLAPFPAAAKSRFNAPFAGLREAAEHAIKRDGRMAVKGR